MVFLTSKLSKLFLSYDSISFFKFVFPRETKVKLRTILGERILFKPIDFQKETPRHPVQLSSGEGGGGGFGLSIAQ